MNGIRAQYDREQTASTTLRELGRDVKGYDEPDATRSRTEDGRGEGRAGELAPEGGLDEDKAGLPVQQRRDCVRIASRGR